MESKVDLLRQENARLVAKNNKEALQTELKVLRKLNSMTKISEIIPMEDTKLRKKFIKQIEKFEKSLIDHMDHL
ncbi:hypothetical protein C1645_834864 [Glomus cerebriforme]|uniref:Uncharacterized protein n=1 Tax=Glomus cerebriforme TaxID=658196 RepID=A0A397S9W5_9GLOM|nr:hypothetical protein C1645_834864 [Glomus cerebriforme]